MSALARVLVVCGGAVALTAATIGVAFFGLRSWLCWAPLAAGVAAAAAGGLLGLRGEQRHAPQARARARLAVEAVGIFAVAAAVNALALRFPVVVDVTSSQRNTLAEASVQAARALSTPVHVRAALAAEDRAWRELVELVDRYRREVQTPDALTLERIDPSADPEGAARDARVVVSSGDRRQRLRFEAGAPDHEALLTRALRTVALEQRARVYVLAGHDEASLSDDGPAGLRRFGQALVDEGAEVVPLPLGPVALVPDDAALLVVAAARGIPPDQAGVLQQWFEGGGRALVLLEPGQPSGLESMLASVGVQADDDVIRDGSAFAGVLGGPEAATGVAYAAHPVTTKLGGAMTHFLRARSLSINPGTPAEPAVLVQTSAEAWGETTPGSTTFEPGDVEGPLAVALAVELLPEAGRRAPRLIVAGDASFASNQGMGLGANQDLALNAALWLLARDEQIVVRPRGRGGNLLMLSPSARERIAFSLLYGLPVALLCAGLSVAALRRRR